MKNKITMMLLGVAILGLAAPTFAENAKHVMKKGASTISTTGIVGGVNPVSGTTDGPGSAVHTERGDKGYGMTNGLNSGPSGGDADAPRVMPRETR